MAEDLRAQSEISIHAPTKGATSNVTFVTVTLLISIHAPTKGATPGWRFSSVHTGSFQSTLPRRERPCPTAPWRHWSHFNPRSHEGSDFLAKMGAAGYEISIHAPTKGATIPETGILQPKLFQSTLPRRERPVSLALQE